MGNRKVELTEREAAYILTVIDWDKRDSAGMIIETVIGEPEAKRLAKSIIDKVLVGKS